MTHITINLILPIKLLYRLLIVTFSLRIRVIDMIEFSLVGKYYEIGYYLGKKIDENQLSYYSRKFSKEQKDFAHECEIIVKQFFPEILEEIQGIADGSQLDYNNLIVSEIAGELKHSCTVLAIPAKIPKVEKLFLYEAWIGLTKQCHLHIT